MTLSQTRTKTVLHQFRHSIHCKSQEELGKKNTKQESRFWCHSSKNYKLWHCSLLQEYASPLAINNTLVRVCSYGVVLCCYLTWLQHFSCLSGLSPWVSGGPSGPWDTCASEPTPAPRAAHSRGAQHSLTASSNGGSHSRDPEVSRPQSLSRVPCTPRHMEIRQKHCEGGSAAILTDRWENKIEGG